MSGMMNLTGAGGTYYARARQDLTTDYAYVRKYPSMILASIVGGAGALMMYNGLEADAKTALALGSGLIGSLALDTALDVFGLQPYTENMNGSPSWPMLAESAVGGYAGVVVYKYFTA